MYRHGTRVPLFFYGSPVYPTTTKDEYITHRQCSSDLEQLPLLKKCTDTLSLLYGKEVEHLSGSSYPGFHIFKQHPGCDNYFKSDRYHIDTDVFKFAPEAKIYSFVVIISTTSKGDSLDYVDHHANINYEYGERDMYVWDGSVPHKIGDVDLTKGGKRITYQGHVLVSDKLYYYW